MRHPATFSFLSTFALAFSLTVSSSCSSTFDSTSDSAHVASPRADAHLAELARCMSGSFSSAAQAQRTADAPEDQRYFDIHLHMAPIWTENSDGHWFYVEQAMSTQPEKPYRQRVYHVHAEEGGFASDVYLLPGASLDFAGAWAKPELLAGVKRESLVLREGCSIHLTRRADGVFEGATRGTLCPSERQGAAYATARVTITPTMLSSWDQGFDASGKQVWGATAGPYEFVKLP